MFHIFSCNKLPITEPAITKTTNTIQAKAFTIVSGNHVFFISIAINTFFTTDQSQYINQIKLTIIAKKIFTLKENLNHIKTKIKVKIEITKSKYFFKNV